MRVQTSFPDQGAALRAARGAVSDAAASARAARAASGRSPRGARPHNYLPLPFQIGGTRKMVEIDLDTA